MLKLEAYFKWKMLKKKIKWIKKIKKHFTWSENLRLEKITWIGFCQVAVKVIAYQKDLFDIKPFDF